jgi:hypothetical protein
MKLRAVYLIKNANPFLLRIEDYLSQFQYAVAKDLPDDVDMKQMEAFAREMTPEGFDFLRLEKIN